MHKILSIATIALPFVIILAIYGPRWIDNLTDDKNDRADVKTQDQNDVQN